MWEPSRQKKTTWSGCEKEKKDPNEVSCNIYCMLKNGSEFKKGRKWSSKGKYCEWLKDGKEVLNTDLLNNYLEKQLSTSEKEGYGDATSWQGETIRKEDTIREMTWTQDKKDRVKGVFCRISRT